MRPGLIKMLRGHNITLYTIYLQESFLDEAEHGSKLLSAIRDFQPDLIVLYAWGHLCELLLPAQTTELGVTKCYTRLATALQTIAAVRGCPVIIFPAECVPLDNPQYLLYLKSKAYLSYTDTTEPAELSLNLANVKSLIVRKRTAFILNNYFEKLTTILAEKAENKLYFLPKYPQLATEMLSLLICSAQHPPVGHAPLWLEYLEAQFTQLSAEAARLAHAGSGIVRGLPGMGYTEHPLHVNITLKQRSYSHRARAFEGLVLSKLLDSLDRPLVRAAIWRVAPKQQSHTGNQVGDFARSCLTTFVPLLFEEETCYLFLRGEQVLLENGSTYVADTSYRFALSNGSARKELLLLVLDWVRPAANLPRLRSTKDILFGSDEEMSDYQTELLEFLSDPNQSTPNRSGESAAIQITSS